MNQIPLAPAGRFWDRLRGQDPPTPDTLTPHLGIGDLLITKMIEIKNNLEISQININESLIREYSSDYNTKIIFSEKLIRWLFPYVKIKFIKMNLNLSKFNNFIQSYNFQRIPLYHHVSIPDNLSDDYSDTLVFHTKFRHDGLMDKCNASIIPQLIELFKTYKTNRKIIIMGEREIGTNKETVIHKTVSLYKHMMTLKNNNNVLDITKDILTEGTLFDNFLSDVEIINKCKCNIVFGVGGPSNIASAFAKESITFLPFLKESPYYDICIKMFTNICENVKELEQQLNRYI